MKEADCVMKFLFFNIAFLMLLCGLEATPLTIYPQRRYLNSRFLLTLGISYLCFLAMFRGASCGNDTENYREFFQTVASQKSLWYTIQHTSFEPLFTALAFFLSRITRNSQILIIVSSLFSFIVTGRFLAKFSRAPCFSLYLFFTLQIFDFYLSGIRQTLAISMLLLAYEAMLEKSNLRTLLLILLAGFFHRTAWICFPIFFLIRIYHRQVFVKITILVSLVCLLGSRYIIAVIASVFPRYQLYFGSSYLRTGLKLSLVLYFLVFSMVLLVGELGGTKDSATTRNKQDELDFRLSFLLLAVCVLGYTAPVFSRILQYFQLYLCVYFANRLYNMSIQIRRILLLFSLIAFAIYTGTIHFLRTPEWYTTYPFVFCWNN